MSHNVVSLFRPKPEKIIEELYAAAWTKLSDVAKEQLCTAGFGGPTELYYAGKGFHHRVMHCDDLSVFEAYCEFQEVLLGELIPRSSSPQAT